MTTTDPVDLRDHRRVAEDRAKVRLRSRNSPARWTWALLALAALLASLFASGFGREDVTKPRGASLVAEFFLAAVHPRTDAHFLALTADAAMTTLAYAVLGTALSLLLGVVGGVLGSQIWWRAGERVRRTSTALGGWGAVRVILAVPRGIHEVVWGLFFLSIFGIQPIVAVLAIGIPFGAVTAKVFSEILDETSRRPYTALISSGARRGSALVYGLFPPALPDLISYAFYRFECAIRSAAVLGLIGAGGIGFQLRLSFQVLRYSEIWTLLYALIILSCAADLWSSTVRHRRERPLGASAHGSRRDRVLTGSVVVSVVLIPLCAWWTGLDFSVLWASRTWQLAGQFIGTIGVPDLSRGRVAELLRSSGTTVAMSVIAIVVAFSLGVLAAPLAARPSQSHSGTGGGRVFRTITVIVTRALLVVLRAIPPPVWALLLLFVLFPGILPGALALAVYTTGVLGRLMAEAAENLEERPLRALRAQGASQLQVFCYGVVPSAMPRFVAYGLYRWEVTMRETIVVGVVGAGGLGLTLNQQLASFDYRNAAVTLLVLTVLTLLVDFASAAIRRSFR